MIKLDSFNKTCLQLSVNLSLLPELQNGPFPVVKNKCTGTSIQKEIRKWLFVTGNLFTGAYFTEGWLSEAPIQIKNPVNETVLLGSNY